MKIELLREWLGHKRGAVLELTDQAARSLIQRKTAKPYKEKAAPGKKNVRKTS